MKSIKIPFSFSGGKTQTTTSLNTIAEQKIVDLLTTNKYERVMRHRYGVGMGRLLFEPIDELILTDMIADARQESRESISRVEILDIRIVPQNRMTAYTSPETTVGVNVVYRLPLGSPQIVRFNIAVPGQLTEDSFI
jgi:phage baseplate assembly protein W